MDIELSSSAIGIDASEAPHPNDDRGWPLTETHIDSSRYADIDMFHLQQLVVVAVEAKAG